MDDQLDDDLKNHIREVFDNYHDTDADEGWLLLRKKYPEKKQRRAIAWYWRSAAALLLLFLVTGILFNSRNANNPQLAYHPKEQVKRKKNQTDDITNSSARNDGDISPNNTKASQALVQQADKGHDSSFKQQARHNRAKKMTSDSDIRLASKNNEYEDRHSSEIAANQKKRAESIGLNDLNEVNPAGKSTDTGVNQPLTDSANNKAKNLAVVHPKSTQEEKKNIYDMFKNGSKDPAKQSKKEDKKVHFSVYAATYFNYAKGSGNQFNGGAGFSSDISLSKNFKLSTGLAIGQNTLNYNSSLPDAAVKTFAVAAAFNYSANSAAVNVASPTFKNYSASLVSLDVPVNLKFYVSPERSDAFISAGLSSGTFANETYVLRYNNPAFFNPAAVQTQDETTHKSFSNFYFANTLNFSFGVGYPVGKFNRLIIEPFLKYPLQGLGDQQIRFGSGGLNLKFNFQPQKK